jgi:hypothetical protein
MEQRGFKCRIQEGTYSGEVTVWLDAEAVESGGNEYIEAKATAQWRRQFGPSIGMAYYSVQVVEEITEQST